VGVFVLIAVWLLFGSHATIGRMALFILAVFEVWGGVVSWTGIVLWQVPFPNKEFFQVSMAFADLLSATFMFTLCLSNDSGRVAHPEP